MRTNKTLNQCTCIDLRFKVLFYACRKFLIAIIFFILVHGVAHNFAFSLEVPRNFSVTPSSFSRQSFMNWDSVSGAVRYDIQRANILTGFGFCDQFATYASTNLNVFTDDNVIPGIHYSYRVRAVDSNGNTSCSNSDNMFIEVEGPTDVKASDGAYSGKVRITWAGTGACIYHIYRSNDGYNGWTRVNIFFAQMGGAAEGCGKDFRRTNYWVDTDVINGTTYWYRVEALKLYGGGTIVATWSQGEDSGYASGTPSPQPPDTDPTFDLSMALNRGECYPLEAWNISIPAIEKGGGIGYFPNAKFDWDSTTATWTWTNEPILEYETIGDISDDVNLVVNTWNDESERLGLCITMSSDGPSGPPETPAWLKASDGDPDYLDCIQLLFPTKRTGSKATDRGRYKAVHIYRSNKNDLSTAGHLGIYYLNQDFNDEISGFSNCSYGRKSWSPDLMFAYSYADERLINTLWYYWVRLENEHGYSGYVSDTGYFAGYTGGSNEGCLAISPTSKAFGSSGGTGKVSVTSISECSWTALSNSSWLTITSGGSGSGNGIGTVNYSVASNPSDSTRTGSITITIAGETFTVTQTGVGDPTPSIKANDSDGPVTIQQADNLSVAISLDSDSSSVDSDWWVAVNTPFAPPNDWLYFDLDSGWIPGLSFTLQGPLFDLGTITVLNMAGFPIGTYTFYFAVDTNMNGVLDFGELFLDSVVVNITP